MKRLLLAAFLLLCSTILPAQTKVNPSYQINWPAVTGSGVPTAACTSVNYGQPYRDTTNHVSYVCDTTGWVVDPSGGGMVYPGAGIAYTSNGIAWGTPLTKFGSATGLATSTDPGTTAEVPMVADGIHGQKSSAGGPLGTAAFTASAAYDAAGAAAAVQTNLTAEVNRAEAAEGTNATAIAAETTRAETAESGKEPALGNPGTNGYVLSSTTGGVRTWIANGSGGGMVYPGAGLPVSTGSAWGTSKAAPAGAVVGTTDTQTIQNKTLDTTNTFPALNQNTTGTAANLSGTPALPNGTAATTQAPGDATTKLATDAFVSAAVAVETARATGVESTNATAISTETTRAETAEALALQKSNNLSDLASASTARTNLGLGTAALAASSAFDAAGAAAAVTTTSIGALPANGVTSTGSGSSNVVTFPGNVTAGTTLSAPQVTISGTPSASTDAVTVGYVGSHSAATGNFNPIQPFFSGPLQPKLVMLTGDSTTASSGGFTSGWCSRTGPGQELTGLSCSWPSTYSIDSSHNVTVVMAANLPPNCTAGNYIAFDASSTFQANALNNSWSNSTFLIASATSNSVTFNNTGSAGATSSSGAYGVATCSIINNGSNGSTQSGYNSGSGQGSAAFVTTMHPDLDVHDMGINDVRGGAVSAAQLEVLYKAYIDNIRANSPKTAIVLITPNSLLQDDPGSYGWVTSPSTTSTTAVASTGSQTITLATMLNSIAGLVTPDMTLAQEVANGSASLVMDTGGSQETVPITAINIAAGTVTATFANTHTSGFAVVPTLATMAQAYTNILHDATMSFEGTYPNVQVVDTQSVIYGRLAPVSTQTTYMVDQLHPSYGGYDARSAYLAAVLAKDHHFGGSHGTHIPNSGTPTFHTAAASTYSPFLSLIAINNNYSACWTNGYFQCVENPDYYTLIGSGGLIVYASASYIRIATESDALAAGSTFGVIPCQAGDVVEIVGYAVAVVGIGGCTPLSTYTQVSTGSTIPAGISFAPVRLYRPRFRSAAQEFYAKSTGIYTFHHAISNSSSGTNYFRFSYTDTSSGITWGGAYTTADVIVWSNGTVQALTGASFSRLNDTTVQVNLTGSFGSLPSTGDIYGTHAMEGTYSIPTTPSSYTLGTGVTSCGCASGATCTTSAGSLTLVGGTGTTGTVCSPVWTATASALKCGVWQNGGATFYGIGNTVATTTGFSITSAVSVAAATITINYACLP